MADIGASNWNEDDASNNASAPDGWPEGMPPSGVNNAARAMMGAIKRLYRWLTPATTAGSSTAYTLAYGVAPGALVDGMTHLVQFNAAPGIAPTLSINGLASCPLHYYSVGAWRLVPAGLWGADQIFRVAYHSTSGTYRLLHFDNRTGELAPYVGSTAPSGSLLCYGQVVSRTAYAGLFAALGTTHNIGGEAGTDFRLPDLRGRVPAGADNMGGSAANRLTATTLSPNGNTIGATGGAQTETASISGTASGTLGALTVNVSGVTDGPNTGIDGSNSGSGSSFNFSNPAHTHAFTATGSTGPSGVSFPVGGTTTAAVNIQPTIISNYLIRL